MDRIKELINRLCPNGVEFKKLGEVVNILDSKRKPISKGKRVFGIYPYYGANGIQDYVDNYIFDGTYILMGEDGSVINKDNTPVLNWTSGKIWVNNHAHILSEREGSLLRFLFYVLQTKDISSIVRGTPPKLTQYNLKNIIIPIPPFEIQKEIVRILDNFTKLINELTNELTARKKQYDYYRNKLLTFDKDDEKVRWVKLGEIANFRNGRGHEKIITSNINDYIVVNSKFISTDGNIKKYCSQQLSPLYIDDILIVMSDLPNGKALAKTFIIKENDKYTLNQRIGAISVKEKDKINTRFLSYSLNRNKQLLRYDNGVDQTNLKTEYITSVILPIPSIEIQEQIVEILDRFKQFCNDLTEGLPAEIEARRKQYEYYRDKLLTFKEKKA